MIWLKKISRVFHVSKCRGKSLETFYDEICFLLIVFFGPVILIANCHRQVCFLLEVRSCTPRCHYAQYLNVNYIKNL